MQKSIEKLKQYTKQPSTHYEENSGKGQQILEQGTQANYGFNYTQTQRAIRHRWKHIGNTSEHSPGNETWKEVKVNTKHKRQDNYENKTGNPEQENM